MIPNPIRPPQQFIVDQNGTRTHVILPLEEYEELIDQLLDARDIAQLPALREETGERITIEALAARVGVKM